MLANIKFLLLVAVLPALDTCLASSISTDVPKWTTIAPGGRTLCALGGEFTFFTREGFGDNRNNLVVELQGGGCCFNFVSCNIPHLYTKSIDSSVLQNLQTRGGIGSATDERNPVLGWTHVFIPYCTGDAHLGNATASYGVHHMGRINFNSALDWAVANVKAPGTVLVTGGSAGSVATYVLAPWVFNAFPAAKHVQFGDSFAPLFGEIGYNDGMQNWPMSTAYYPGLGVDLGPWRDYVAAYNTNITARKFPDATWASYVSNDDVVQKGYYAVEGCGAENCDWVIAMRKALRVAHDAPNFNSFIAPGYTHIVTESDSMYSKESEGIQFIDWLTEIINGPGQHFNNRVDCKDTTC